MTHAFLAGKDRTGSIAAIILLLAGVPKATIASDYALSRIGVEPYRTRLAVGFEKAFGTIDYEKPGITEMSGVSPEAMMAFLATVEEKFGSAEGYLRSELGLAEADIDKIKENIAVR
jgi:protein tyrosine/serine phosphatase